MSWKHLFARTLPHNPRHFAAHSHHLWPDASFEGQQEAWEDAAVLADRKWDKVFGEVWPEAQRHVAAELHLPDPDTIVFAPNTHDLLIRIASAIERRPLRIAASAHEFHSFRRQVARWLEAGLVTLTHDLSALVDLVWISHVAFATGDLLVPELEAAAALAKDGRLVVVDGYHSFAAIPVDLSAAADRLFFVGGGYKYAMAGEGVAFAHCPPGLAERPLVTGWFAEFEDLSLPSGQVGYAKDARRLLGATFDPSGLYRFNHVQRMLRSEGLTTASIAAHVAMLQRQFVAGLEGTPLAAARLLNPLEAQPHARFLAFELSQAGAMQQRLAARGITTDNRGDVLRIGFGLYHDPGDIDDLLAQLRTI